MFDVVTIGEMLVDFSPHYTSGRANVLFEPNPGGAPANVACALAHLGCKTSFIGKVGADAFGAMCRKALRTMRVSTKSLTMDKNYNTTLAFVELDKSGDRKFSFYRNETTADVNLRPQDINNEIYNNTKFFHFGSVSLSCEPARTTVLEAVKASKANGCIITYDPNLRFNLWDNIDDLKQTVLDTIKYADVLKFSEEELKFLFPGEFVISVLNKIYREHKTPVIVVTKGHKGCDAIINGKIYRSTGYKVDCVDTTGAGDSFFAGLIYMLTKIKCNLNELYDSIYIKEMLDFANATGALVTTKMGAIPAMPTAEDVVSFIEMTDK